MDGHEDAPLFCAFQDEDNFPGGWGWEARSLEGGSGRAPEGDGLLPRREMTRWDGVPYSQSLAQSKSKSRTTTTSGRVNGQRCGRQWWPAVVTSLQTGF
jgi:hypothetical protein